ncbi:carbohydrate porin [Acidovorax soli]|nr:carbohydrate porin [Acidovorax soli]
MMFRLLPARRHARSMPLALLLVAAAPWRVAAQAVEAPAAPPPVAWHAQATWAWQAKPAFAAPYTGPNSLVPGREKSYSFTTTGDLGVRLWQGAEAHFNPEAAQGVPLSRLTGAGGLSNGELARTSGANLSVYRARMFVQQRWATGGDAETIPADFNELGGASRTSRWTVRAGAFSLLDYFDNNPYAKDPREQFFNWSFLTHGAWDYAADARGYSVGAMIEYRTSTWAVRAARMELPRESNGLALDSHWRQHYGDQLEVESDLPVSVPAGPLRARLLVYRNRAVMGRFDDALALGGTPDVAWVRRAQSKTGWGVTLEAPLGEEAGLFLRASRNNGQSETYAFTEIDQQLSLGGQFTGATWGRSKDRWGVAWAANGLSRPHRSYLAAGGQGFFLGDGRLNYGPEQVLEAYYRWTLPDVVTSAGTLRSAFSLGAQHLVHPGYNRDRGPVQVYSLRWHSEF